LVLKLNQDIEVFETVNMLLYIQYMLIISYIVIYLYIMYYIFCKKNVCDKYTYYVPNFKKHKNLNSNILRIIFNK